MKQSSIRKMVWSTGILLFSILGSSHLFADNDRPLPPITHDQTRKACGDCHMVFPPQMLPSASWEKIMNHLTNHFGENASLVEGERQEIAKYLMEHAGDTGGQTWGRKFLRGIKTGETPLRLSETPYWQREHSNKEVSPMAFQRPEVKSAANCPACHKQAEQGIYED